MKTVGSYEAKTHLSRLLEEVEKGETIIITRHGIPIAQLTPSTATSKTTIAQAIEQLRSLRQEISLDGTSIREMIEEGRRF
ncbi:type II toxin-antitoxin system Phd/YefM family antitoxin [Chroogloeocystis siderophila]|jgi:prevent-host-death family protein|uniref:Antitoxin n=1 Tax=Chroogloeocystis siderophila 5.2 s.c.1 TaxID=247279 RepID=A0A1U7HW29_9CHRO|nr:type II toxin-antitoxin system prevent-host-death family antitoxin [Chroogloeocystis siderophila]OKH27779.1 prevent-host-death protein [Chroogloeocystis siderophila 5.2 s.c.1]